MRDIRHDIAAAARRRGSDLGITIKYLKKKRAAPRTAA
jgi:hypothetical protein